MDPVQIVIFSGSGVVCGLMAGVVTLLILSLLIGKKKVKSLGDATENLADNTMAFTRTVSRLGDSVVRLGSAASEEQAVATSDEEDSEPSADETWEGSAAAGTLSGNHPKREREREGERDPQTDRKTGRQKDRQRNS